MFDSDLIVRRVPKWIVDRTKENVEGYNMGIYDAFKEAVSSYPKLKHGSKLWEAWFYDDFRKYIPSAYMEEYLDFRKHPIKTQQGARRT